MFWTRDKKFLMGMVMDCNTKAAQPAALIGGMLQLKFSFLLTHQTHMTMYKYCLTCSYDSLVQICPDDSCTINNHLLMLTQLAY